LPCCDRTSPASAQHDDDDDDDDDDGHVIAPVLSEAEPRGTGMVDRFTHITDCPVARLLHMQPHDDDDDDD
jgi:hypothetical protein